MPTPPRLLSLLCFLLCCCCCAFAEKDSASAQLNISRYNVIWNSPSKDASGVMPIGNGDMAAGVYAIENGDLYLLLAKNDAYTYMGDLFKTGRVKITLSPNPFISGKSFRQTLDLATGSILIEADGVQIRVWSEMNRPLTHVQIQSSTPLNVTARPDLWKRFDACTYNSAELYDPSILPSAGKEPTQDVQLERNGKLLWYFPVGDHSIYPDDLKYYQVENMAGKFPDPFRFNTFGNLLESPDLQLTAGALSGKGQHFDLRIHALTLQTPDPNTWIQTILQQTAQPIDLKSGWENHLTWWRDFWSRGWIRATDRSLPETDREQFVGESSSNGLRAEKDGAALVSQSYNVFRFLMACQSRGQVQVKFNGGLFTQQLLIPENDKHKRSGVPTKVGEGYLTHEDDRLWGRRFTYQNQRLLYWPLLMSGDNDLIKPFFDYYWNLLPLRKAITKAWFEHDGAYFRENIEPTGAERDCGKDGRPLKAGPGQPAKYYHDFYFTNGLETVAIMIDYVQFTGDSSFRDNRLVPFAREILLFYSKHYMRGPDGKLRMDPAQVLETFWRSVNPTPDIAGLRFCLDELLAYKIGTPEDQKAWAKFRSEIPEIPTRLINGKKAIAPAEVWDTKHNSENGDLYAVFPFRCLGVNLGSGDLVRWTMENRICKNAMDCSCWGQDQIDWAYAGEGNKAAEDLVTRFRHAFPGCRFPLYGQEGPDSCPDFDHFGAGSIALQRMLLQEVGNKLYLLPAWPAKWDVEFKLHASAGTVIEGQVKNGKLTTWKISPESRKADIILGHPQM